MGNWSQTGERQKKMQANVLHFGGSQLPKKRGKRTNNDLQSITQKTIDRATCICISTRKRGSIPLWIQIFETHRIWDRRRIRQKPKCQTINKFFSKQIPFIEKGTRWHYNCCNHSTRPFTPEHESGTATSSSLSKATTASIINILSEWFWYPKHRSMSRWNYWQALGKMLTTFPSQQG
jgi:hypothetical protein